jgi:hypothetical protein
MTETSTTKVESRHTAISKEAQLILCASKILISEEDEKNIRELITFDLDWGTLLYLCAHHRVTPLVLRTLENLRLTHSVENNVIRMMRNESAGIYAQNKLFQGEIEKINLAFMSNGIKAVLLKGAILSALVYKDLTLRQFVDFDYLVNEIDLPNVTDVLIGMGYTQGGYDVDSRTIVPATKAEKVKRRMYTHEIVEFLKLSGNRLSPLFNVDINFAIFWKGSNNSFVFDPNELIRHSTLTPMNNSTVHCLPPIYQIVQLCAHLYNEAVWFCWHPGWVRDKGDLNLIKFCDIRELISANEIKWDELITIVQISKIEVPVFFALSGLNRLFGDVVPDNVLSRLGVDRDVIDYFYDRRGNRLKWGISFEQRMFDIKIKTDELRSRKDAYVLEK